ncbi:MAG: hypothetical protein NW215_05130 [Hyphomicrobiales bacterium]|nr:hypothetical protein [Hyphomicrobiales bacterium]
MTTNPSPKPTHAVYHVRGKAKGYWTKIGAGWLHDDKHGLNLSLDLLPANSEGRIVIRIAAEKQAELGAAQ